MNDTNVYLEVVTLLSQNADRLLSTETPSGDGEDCNRCSVSESS